MRRARLGYPNLVWILLLTAVPILRPLAAHAEIIDEEEVKHFTLGFYGGFVGNSMSRYNQNIDVVNYFLSHQGNPLRNADKLRGSASMRAEMRYKFGQRVSVGLAISNTESKSSFNVTFGEANFYARSTVVAPMVYYHLPFVQTASAFESVADRMSLYVGGGPVFLLKPRTNVRIVDRTTATIFLVDGDLGEIDGEGKAQGSGAGLQGVIGASYQLTSRVSFAGEIGYRHARASSLTLSDVRGFIRDRAKDDPHRREPEAQAIYDFFQREKRAAGLPDNDIRGKHIPYYSDYSGPLDLDFSGVILQVGMRFHLF